MADDDDIFAALIGEEGEEDIEEGAEGMTVDEVVAALDEDEMTVDEGVTEIDSRIFIQEDEDAMEPTDHAIYEDLLEIDSTKNNTIPYMTKYERAAVKGLRAQQLSKNAPPMIPASVFPQGVYPTDDAILAEEEIHLRKCPIIISRPFPNGTVVRVPVSNLKT